MKRGENKELDNLGFLLLLHRITEAVCVCVCVCVKFENRVIN